MGNFAADFIEAQINFSQNNLSSNNYGLFILGNLYLTLLTIIITCAFYEPC